MTEFDDVIRRLEDGRPQATAPELDEIKQRVRRRAADPSRRSQSMKSRVAILGMLVTGMLFSTAGAGLAVSSLAQQTDNAAVSQYGTPTPTPTYVCTPTPQQATASQEEGSGGNAPSQNDQCGEGGVLPATEDNAPAPASESGGGVLPAQDSETGAATQPERQVAAAADTDELPFTGFAAIPVLLGGLALLTGGLILRRRTQ